MKTLNYTLIDHLGDDFEYQTLLERKRRVDAQIEEHLKVYSIGEMTKACEDIIIETLHNLLIIQRDITARIKFLRAICLN